MGKSAASCFRIITCASDSVDQDDLQKLQSKVSSDQRGWSFRKRSATHRVLSSTAISESSSSPYKESSDSTAANLQVQPSFIVPEKNPVIQWKEEKCDLSAQTNTKPSDVLVAREDDCRADATLDESSIILIQSTIRGYLAQRMFLKQKNIIKLQAALRGYLVRRDAVGTLQCFQAIVKMQALVRARRGKKNFNLILLRGKSEAKPNHVHKKLHSNKFACQFKLMESAGWSRPINIKCDPSKSDSAWKWLERWMSVSLANNEEPQESGSTTEQLEKVNIGSSDSKVVVLVPTNFVSESKDVKSAVGPSAETYDNDSSLITYDADSLASMPTSLIHPMLSYIDESHSRYDATESGPTEMRETNLILKVEANSALEEKFSKEQPEIEAKGVSAQSKSQELSPGPTTEKLTTLCSNDLEVESNLDRVTASTSQPFRPREMMGLDDSSISNVQVAGSECGTELSISSTLDSPDRSEFNDLEQEPKILDETDHSRSRDYSGLEANVESDILGSEISFANINQMQSHESVYPAAGDSASSVITADSPPFEKKLKVDESNTEVELGSQGTPSSKVSFNIKKSKGEKRESNRKNRSSPSHDSTEQSQEHKTGKRRNSLDSAKRDHSDQERRDSNRSNPLPSYMQATESARAKSLSDRSPVSSPGVADKDIFIKKRQSLSGSNGSQRSPRVHRPLSQQPNGKGNGIHSSQARKWQR